MAQIKATVRRVKFWWHLTFAYFVRYRIWLVITVSATILVIFSFLKILPLVNRQNVVTIGYVGSYTLERLPTQILALATQSLITAGYDGKPLPSLASHWTVSEDGKTYVIFLKDNLRWHDDSAVNANDVSIAISHVAITALNNKAIEFKLPNPIASFPLFLDKPVFKAKSFYGTGLFRIVNISSQNDIVKKITLAPKSADLPRVDIKFYPTEEQAINALKIGEVKMAHVINAQLFEKWPNLEVERKVNQNEVVTIFYNNSDPLLSSKELRQALSFAINREGFDGVHATGPIPPSNWAYNEAVKKYDYNTSRAKELLSKANIQTPNITLTLTPGLEDLSQKIKKDWEDMGASVTLKTEKSIPKNFQALLTHNQLAADPDQYALWHSTQKETNISGYKNVKIDKLLEDARTTLDEQKRKELYADFQKFIVEDAPVTFLYHPYEYQVVYKNIKPLLAKLPK